MHAVLLHELTAESKPRDEAQPACLYRNLNTDVVLMKSASDSA
jgi:hypothetical protein